MATKKKAKRPAAPSKKGKPGSRKTPRRPVVKSMMDNGMPALHRSARADAAKPDDRCAFPVKLKGIALPTEDNCRLAFSIDQADMTIDKARHFLVDAVLEANIKVDPAGDGDLEGQAELIETRDEIKVMGSCAGFSYSMPSGRINTALTFHRDNVDMGKLARFIKQKGTMSVVRVCEASG